MFINKMQMELWRLIGEQRMKDLEEEEKRKQQDKGDREKMWKSFFNEHPTTPEAQALLNPKNDNQLK